MVGRYQSTKTSRDSQAHLVWFEGLVQPIIMIRSTWGISDGQSERRSRGLRGWDNTLGVGPNPVVLAKSLIVTGKDQELTLNHLFRTEKQGSHFDETNSLFSTFVSRFRAPSFKRSRPEFIPISRRLLSSSTRPHKIRFQVRSSQESPFDRELWSEWSCSV